MAEIEILSKTNVLAMKTPAGIKFGRELREKEFLFEKEWMNLNHGSYGAYPHAVRTVLRSFQDALLARPDDFVRHRYAKHLDASREAMSKLLKTQASNLVFVSNSTTAINIVLRNLTYEPGEYILYFATTYGACERTVLYMTETTPVQAIKMQFSYPVEDDWLVSEFRRTIENVKEKGGKVKIAIFDTVVSSPGVRMPFERLTAACKELGVLSYVDGAHGVGQIALDLEALDPDFFTSSCHKWLFAPQGCAIFYVPIRNQNLMRSTLPTSHGFEPQSVKIDSPFAKVDFVQGISSKFTVDFMFVGTLDNAPQMCIPEALKWRESMGGEEAIMAYNITLAQEAGKYLAKALNTEFLDNKTHTLIQCAMSNVRLPISREKADAHAERCGLSNKEVGSGVRDWLQRVLVDEFNTFIHVHVSADSWWARLSGQVYLEMSDFEWAAEALKKTCDRVDKGEWAVAKNVLLQEITKLSL